MSILLKEFAFSKNDVFDIYLKNVTHIFELDFFRNDSTTIWSQDEDSTFEKVHVLGYSIVENKSSNQIDFKNYANLLFLNEYNQITNINTTFINTTSNEYLQQIEKFINIDEIPSILKDNDMIEIEKGYSVQRVIHIIDRNISYIQNKGIDHIYVYSIYIHLYDNILTTLSSMECLSGFLEAEVNTIKNFVRSVQSLKIAINSDIQRQEAIVDKDAYNDVRNQNKHFIEMLSLISYIDICLHKNSIEKSDIDWVKSICDKSCEIYIKGQTIRVENYTQNFILFNEYANLSKFDNIDVNLVMEKFKYDDEENIQSTTNTIEITCSPWVYIFNKLYPNDTIYTEAKDVEVQEILSFIHKTKIPFSYILR